MTQKPRRVVMKSLKVVFCLLVMVLLGFFTATASAAGGGDPGIGLGGSFFFDEFSSFSWSVRDPQDCTYADVGATFQHKELNYASWSFYTHGNDTSYWTAQLYMNGPISDEALTPGVPRTMNSSIKKGGASLDENLYIGYWYNTNTEATIMNLSGGFALSPSIVYDSNFNYQEYSSMIWNDDGTWTQSEEPNNWCGTLSINGRFLDTQYASAAAIGAMFPTQSVPEPSMFALMATGIIAVGFAIWRKRRSF